MKNNKQQATFTFINKPWFSIIIMAVFVFLGLIGPYVVPYDPHGQDLMGSFTPPPFFDGGSWIHPMGTDQLGRDVLSRLIAGTRASLIVGFAAVFVAGAIGAMFALVAGYSGGWLDAAIMRLTDAMLSMPFFLIAIILAGIFGAGLLNIVLIIGIMSWPLYARVLRSQVLQIREMDFVKLALIAGAGKIPILCRHIFPNIVNSLIILATLQLGVTIIAEASLSFLGLGIPPPQPSWGSMIARGREFLAIAWWPSVFPGLALTTVVMATNLLGDWLRLRLDPKFRQL